MLQQTQVERVVPRWHAFMERFPTVESCADSPVAAVIECWDGLGYNRRAVMLHQTATQVSRDLGGSFPSSVTELQKLPGIGAYTSRALVAFTEQGDAGPLDTNIGRILARWIGDRLTPAAAQELADAMVPAGQGWAWNQTLMDFGSALCLKRSPRCDSCPVADACSWQGGQDGTADPAERSAGVSGGQSRFAGSDRQGRGRLVAALRSGPVAPQDVAATMGWPDDPERAQRVLATLVSDGLVCHRGDGICLPA